jgi:UDP-glucose 4-epimerase
MTILITGGAGFIGGHTVLALLDRGEIPIVLDDLSTGNRAAVPSGVCFLCRRRRRYSVSIASYTKP